MSSQAASHMPRVDVRKEAAPQAPRPSDQWSVVRSRRRGPGIALGDTTVQAKLTVGPAGDEYEREADAVATRVVRTLQAGSGNPDMLSGGSQRIQRGASVAAASTTDLDATQPIARIQRSAAAHQGATSRQAGTAGQTSRVQRASTIGAAGGELDSDTQRMIDSSRSGGRPLPDPAKSKMEGAFGADFSGIRVHAGAAAADLNNRIQAKAFTTGNDIYFRDGVPDVSSTAGQALLAHELTHTVQQGSATINRSSDLVQREWLADDGNTYDDAQWPGDPASLEHYKLAKQGGSETQNRPTDWMADDGKWYPIELYPTDRSEADLKADNKRSGQQDKAEKRHAARGAGSSEADGDESVTQTAADSVAGAVGKTAEVSDLQGLGGAFEAQQKGRSSLKGGPDVGGKSILVNDGEGQYAGGHNIVEGTFGLGAAGLTLADKNASKKEKATAGVNATGQGLKAASGSAGTHAAVLGKDASGAQSAKDWSEGLAAGSDSALSAGQFMTAGLDAHAAKEAYYNDALTREEKALEISGKSATVGQNLANSAASVMKVAGGGGAEPGSFALAKNIGEATAVAAVFGIVAGAFDMLAGGYKILKAGNETKQLKQVQATLVEGLRTLRGIPPSGQSAVEVAEAKRLDRAICDNLVIVGDMIGMKAEASSAGKKQAIGGAFAVAGGVLTMTGVGLPIVLSVAVAGALLKLGFVGAQMARNRKTSRWIELAKWLNEDGSVRNVKDESENIGFSEMKDRFVAAYYKDPLDRDPQGLKKDKKYGNLGHDIQQFGRSMKQKEIGKKTADNTRDISTLEKTQYNLYWLEDASTGKVEKHAGKHVYGDFFKLDVARSGQAKSAAKGEVTNVLNHVAWQTFNEQEQQFKTGLGVAQMEPLTAQDRADLGDAEEDRLNHLTDDVILSTTGLKNRAKEYGQEKKKLEAKSQVELTQDAMRKYVEQFVK